ncbi:MFS general substrate transporter [Penicillium citrinum]|uniref:MFS general substrate transporter n=1 Tax=Penicillium citrinum TaxID=5077 RepID=A0A9W9PHC4_PENCI|nr:MFS general substrate transporter [Penicillium citrinum]KAJ5243419.1 MFS general substrate transporter [Penicillium citrinum]
MTEVFKINEVASVRSYIIAAGILGQGCGGPLGGLITDLVGWRWSLVGQAPIGIVCMGLAYYQLPVSMREANLQPSVSLWRFDWGGIVAFLFAVTSFILGTTDGGAFLSSFSKPAFLIASCVFLIIFIMIEKFAAENPIIPPNVVGSPRLSNIFLGQMLYFSSISTILNNIPGYLAKINHLSNSSIAIQIGFCGFGLILGSVIAGKALSNTVKYRKLSLVAISVSALSQIIMIVRWKDGIHGPEISYCLPWAMGSGMLLSAQFISLTIWSPPEQMAKATAVYYLSQQIGLVFGTSISATALQRLFGHQLGHNLVDIHEPEKTKVINHLLGDFGFISNLPEGMQAAVQHSFIEAWRLIPVISREKPKN